MRKRRSGSHDAETALANFALTFAKALLVVFVVLMALISPNRRSTDGIRPNAEFVIMASWPGDRNIDVDLWVRDPRGNIVYYANREAGFLALDRDDIGFLSDTVGNQIVRVNEEIVTIRGILPGEYVINVHLYSLHDDNPPVTVDVRVERLNPVVTRVWRGSATLTSRGHEIHVVRFNMNADGSVDQVGSDRPIMLRNRPPERSR
jgi:hypothetical protein